MDLLGMMGIDIDSVAKDAKEFIGMMQKMDAKLDRILAILDDLEDVGNGKTEPAVKQLTGN